MGVGVGLGIALLIGASLVLMHGNVQSPHVNPSNELLEAFETVQHPHSTLPENFLQAFETSAATRSSASEHGSSSRELFSEYDFGVKCVHKMTDNDDSDKSKKAWSGICSCAAAEAKKPKQAWKNLEDVRGCIDKADQAGHWHHNTFIDCVEQICPGFYKK